VGSPEEPDVQDVSATIQKTFYRNGQLRERVPVRNGRRHGVVRTWHKNGKRASEEPFKNGLLDGVCRQWSEAGRRLGEYRMFEGTGIQREWHDNGKLQMEISSICGEFSGRNRIWLRDGTLLSERFYLVGHVVSAEKYREVAAKFKALPKFRGKPANLTGKHRLKPLHIHRVFVDSLLEKYNHREARKWLAKKTGDKTARSLGRFKRENDAAKFVEALYQAGAVEVIAPDIYRNKARDQFADCLLVHLPRSAAKRKAIRAVCAQLRTRKLGAAQPDEDIGESHLYLSLA
jgi:MORN repeat variant